MRSSTFPITEPGIAPVALVGLSRRLGEHLDRKLRERGMKSITIAAWPREIGVTDVGLVVLASEAPAAEVSLIRRETAAPLMVLTAAPAEDRAAALELGADVCMNANEADLIVESHLFALLRRQTVLPTDDSIVVGNVELDMSARRALVGGTEISLAPREFNLLAHLMRNQGRALRRHEILDAVWGSRFVGEPGTVDVHVSWLRQKLPVDSGVRITTLRGVGYRLDVIPQHSD